LWFTIVQKARMQAGALCRGGRIVGAERRRRWRMGGDETGVSAMALCPNGRASGCQAED
jgi:hypothetical protein